MSLKFLLRGAIIGISIAAPVGPIGILCIRRSFIYGRLVGFISGLGAATADAIYGCIAGFGLTFISHILIEQKIWVRLVGGVFLFYLGIRTFFTKPADEAAVLRFDTLSGSYFSTFFLTLTNPMTIIFFTAIFTGLGVVAKRGDYLSASLIVLGVFTGSASWWLILSNIVSLFRKRVTKKGLQWINRIAGALIFGFGAVAFISAIS